MELSQKQKKERHRTIALQSYHKNRGKHLEARREKVRSLRSADKTIASISKKIDKNTPVIEPSAADLERKIEELREKLQTKELEYQEIQTQGAEMVATDGDKPELLESLALRQSVLRMECDGLKLAVSRTADELKERKAGDEEFSLWWGQALRRHVKVEQRKILTLIEEVVKECSYLCEHSRQLNRTMNNALRTRGEPTPENTVAGRDFHKYMFDQLLTWTLHDFLHMPPVRDRNNWKESYSDSVLGPDPDAKEPKKAATTDLNPEPTKEIDQERIKREKFEAELEATRLRLEKEKIRNEAQAAADGERAAAAMKAGKL